MNETVTYFGPPIELAKLPAGFTFLRFENGEVVGTLDGQEHRVKINAVAELEWLSPDQARERYPNR